LEGVCTSEAELKEEREALNPEDRAKLEALPPGDHQQDEDCAGHIDPSTNLCKVCGVEHGDMCPGCTGRGYHRPGCIYSDATAGNIYSEPSRPITAGPRGQDVYVDRITDGDGITRRLSVPVRLL
jgi:hypothetical protein